MTLEELEMMQRSLNGINGISEVLDFMRLYQKDRATRERNPDVAHYIHVNSIDLRLRDALSTLSTLACSEAININVENLMEGAES
ncbi:MAG: hypothetical protein N0C81_03190 [Candidatus Thiodiazotropha lotti]|nr:hypothetical protein [Candidatus Thiodiazotropha lotti]MCG8004622.1 hypothetical protein [Candidatus Thiodiazotropha lotti]MCG8006639.1 hypothetical protein [Candidatus Thiodiazotropha lotti]MCW4188249.1 hypothetical protein [Candidatus Thiodiazotropha lotti]MCW4194221.1 hypothetical protein [Candidatus Thiodiazotropha lotti]